MSTLISRPVVRYTIAVGDNWRVQKTIFLNFNVEFDGRPSSKFKIIILRLGEY